MKPHLKKVNGFWRVSPLPRPYHNYHDLWMAAHTWANRMNWGKGRETTNR